MRHARLGGLVGGLVITVLLASGSCSPASRSNAVASIEPRAGERAVSATDPATPIEFSVVLRLPGHRALQGFIRRAYDPTSPAYRRFVGARQFGHRYGLSLSRIHRTESVLFAAGLRVETLYPQRTGLRVRGTAAEVGTFFGVSFRDFAGASGVSYHAPVGRPVIPVGLRSTVLGVTGLSDRPVQHHDVVLPDVPTGGLTPDVVSTAYDSAPLLDQGISGQGQTVAVVSFDSFRDSDVQAFDHELGISGPPPQHVRVNGGTPIGDGTIEVNLDIDVLRAVAPQIQILDYEAPPSATLADVVNRIVADGKANIVTDSWGSCDDPRALPIERRADQQALQAAVAQGINFFKSSGDAGAYQCQRNDPSDLRVTVEWPADDPNVIAVGGTLLSVRKDDSYLQEAGWEDILSGKGTGGGLDPVDPRPSYQSGPGVQNTFSNGKRQIPDVAGPADSDSPFTLIFTPPGHSAPLAFYGSGTSAAGPFWAGMAALIQQYAQSKGVKRLGFLNPVLYKLAATKQRSRFPPFHDVTLGGNRYYDCTPGWDFATGLGSPDVYNLARDIVSYLKAHPAR